MFVLSCSRGHCCAQYLILVFIATLSLGRHTITVTMALHVYSNTVRSHMHVIMPPSPIKHIYLSPLYWDPLTSLWPLWTSYRLSKGAFALGARTLRISFHHLTQKPWRRWGFLWILQGKIVPLTKSRTLMHSSSTLHVRCQTTTLVRCLNPYS